MRLGIVGCGKVAATHIAALELVPEIEIVAFCDLDLGLARERAAGHPGALAFSDLGELLRVAGVDAVSVITDHRNHFAPAMTAIEHGVDVLVEKPLTSSLVEGHRLVEAARAHDVILGGVFQRRFSPAALRMKDAIDRGRLGRVVSAQCTSHLARDRAYFERIPWRGTWAGEGGGTLLNHTIHMIDLMLWTVGEPAEIYGRWDVLKHSAYSEVEDVAGAVVTFQNGAIGTIQASTVFEPEGPEPSDALTAPGLGLAVSGAAGEIVGLREWPEMTHALTQEWTFEGEYEDRVSWRLADAEKSAFPTYHAELLRDFADAVTRRRAPLVTGAEAYRAVEAVKAVYLSHARRAPVALPLSADDRAEADRVSQSVARAR